LPEELLEHLLKLLELEQLLKLEFQKFLEQQLYQLLEQLLKLLELEQLEPYELCWCFR
jgi:hypothetical protein